MLASFQKKPKLGTEGLAAQEVGRRRAGEEERHRWNGRAEATGVDRVQHRPQDPVAEARRVVVGVPGIVGHRRLVEHRERILVELELAQLPGNRQGDLVGAQLTQGAAVGLEWIGVGAHELLGDALEGRVVGRRRGTGRVLSLTHWRAQARTSLHSHFGTRYSTITENGRAWHGPPLIGVVKVKPGFTQPGGSTKPKTKRASPASRKSPVRVP